MRATLMYGAGDVRVENVPVKLPVGEDSALLPSLLTLADVYGAGYHAAKRANVNPRTTVTVIGDGAVGLLALLGFRDDA